jgi:hypothetical protein
MPYETRGAVCEITISLILLAGVLAWLALA